MGKIIIERWKNSITTSKAFGKYFGRFKPNGTLDTRQVAQHIQEHGSIYTLPVILGVLAQAEQCIPELVKLGYKVKLDGLGTFGLSIKTEGTDKPEELTPEKLKSMRMHFLAEQSDFSSWKADAMKQGVSFECTDYYVSGSDGHGHKAKVYIVDSTSTSGSGSGSGSGEGDERP